MDLRFINCRFEFHCRLGILLHGMGLSLQNFSVGSDHNDKKRRSQLVDEDQNHYTFGKDPPLCRTAGRGRVKHANGL